MYTMCMNALRRASAFVFYLLGTLTILSIALVQREIFVAPLSQFLTVVDLPLLLSAMLLGGSTLVSSLSREKTSIALSLFVFIPLLAVFGFFAWVNFSMPFVEV